MGVDFASIGIGGISITLLVMGLIEMGKKMGWLKTERSILLASVVVGFILIAYYQAYSMGKVSENLNEWVVILVYGLGGAISIPGLYAIGSKWARRAGGEDV